MEKSAVVESKRKVSLLVRYFAKMKGQSTNPLQVNVKEALLALTGGFLTIFILLYLTKVTAAEWLMAPFGASCVLVFAAWNAPLSQPRNVIGGHFISALVGLVVYYLFGNEPWTLALAVGIAIAAMMVTKTTHPPAGANPIIVILGAYSWSYLFTPVLLGSVVIVGMALLINNLRSNRSYPVFWK
ncbi:HPP family protein [Paenibacillus yanchengensis]|uniref:HPP family protein n=1 Tax=Paenibacillus yanchengensis TaxID=2035833 RepID=A0ABW4YEX8_9BACL